MHLCRSFFLTKRLCYSFRPVLKGKPLCSISIHFHIQLFLAGRCFRPWLAPVPAASQRTGGTTAILSRKAHFLKIPKSISEHRTKSYKEMKKNKIKIRGGNCSDRAWKKEDGHKELEPHVPDELSDWQNKTLTKIRRKSQGGRNMRFLILKYEIPFVYLTCWVFQLRTHVKQQRP